MRLFIALNFSDEVKTQITEIISKVKSNSIQGRFVNEEHLHLTLKFLGEIQNHRVTMIKEALNELEFEAFTISLTELGYFKRREGNIYWLGIKENKSLLDVHNKLHQSLTDKGFELENREYKPHITLGRKVRLQEGFDSKEIDDMAKKIKIDVSSVDLMKSEFLNGKLKYTLLHSEQLF